MAPLHFHYLTKVLFLYLLLLLFVTSISSISSYSQNQHPQTHHHHPLGRPRMLLELGDGEKGEKPITIKKKPTSNPTKNVTKLIKPSSKNQTKLIKATKTALKNQTKPTKPLPSDPTKTNKTKLIKPASSRSNSTKPILEPTIKSQIKKLNKTKDSSSPSKNTSSQLLKSVPTSKNKTSKAATSKDTKTLLEKNQNKPKSKGPDKPKAMPSWIDQDDEDEDDLVSGFRDLPSKFQETFVPDLERISKTSQHYLTKYNKGFTKGFKPYVGTKYASTIASIVSFASLIIPLILVSLIINRVKTYFSIQKLLIFVQIYLAIYFTILGLSSLVTGIEPLRFFYTASQSTYVGVQVLQTLAYVLYLLLLLMYLVVVFSTETGLVTKLLSLVQTFTGFAVGLHYYITVFHRAVLHQPPKSSGKVHALYATCFLVICLLNRIERKKKAYLQEGGEEGKKS